MEENGNIYLMVNYRLIRPEDILAIRQEYPSLIFTQLATGIYSVQVPQGSEAEFERLSMNVQFILSPSPLGLNAIEALDASNISVFHNYPYGALRGNGILMGFVDTGIQYTNAVFKNANNTTRILSIWDQTIPGNPPPAFGYGSVYDEEAINEALSSETPELIVPSTDENGHGTYLAGVAAGNDQEEATGFVGGAPDALIAMVKLRPASERVRQLYVINNQAVAYQDNDILAGISYLMQLATDRNLPLVICIGLGNNYGAHNGTTVIETYLHTLSIAANVIVVVAAGNEGSSGHHYRGIAVNNRGVDVEINVGENSQGFLLYLWTNISNRLIVSIKSPLGQVIERIPALNQRDQVYRFNLEATYLNVRYLYPEFLTGSEEISMRFVNPTPGIWTLTVYGEAVIDGTFHVWLPNRGFVQEETRFLRPDPETTLQMPGTEDFVIVVGAYDYLDDSIYVASGRGPTTSGIIKPDLVAPGVNVQGPSIRGGFTNYVGTSTAAAVTASAAALLMQWATVDGNFPEMNTRIARGILARGARRQVGVVYPNNIEGFGRLDLQRSIASI